MIDVTVIITTFNRPKMLARALDSVLAQTEPPAEIIVANDGIPTDGDRVRGARVLNAGRADGMFLTWYEAIYEAPTDLVAILHDDDWYEPEFLERLVPPVLDHDGCAYALCDGTVRSPDGLALRRNLSHGATDVETGYADSAATADSLLRAGAVLTPSCVVYRKESLLLDLSPGGIPGLMPANLERGGGAGPDLAICLLPLMRYPVCYIEADTLVNLDAGEQSTTVREIAAGARDLVARYSAARAQFSITRAAVAVLRDRRCNLLGVQ